MNDVPFDDLFGTTVKEGGRRPVVCAVTGRRLQKSDHPVRQRIAGTPFYVLCLATLSDDRLKALTVLAQTGKAPKAPAKDK